MQSKISQEDAVNFRLDDIFKNKYHIFPVWTDFGSGHWSLFVTKKIYTSFDDNESFTISYALMDSISCKIRAKAIVEDFRHFYSIVFSINTEIDRFFSPIDELYLDFVEIQTENDCGPFTIYHMLRYFIQEKQIDITKNPEFDIPKINIGKHIRAIVAKNLSTCKRIDTVK